MVLPQHWLAQNTFLSTPERCQPVQKRTNFQFRFGNQTRRFSLQKNMSPSTSNYSNYCQEYIDQHHSTYSNTMDQCYMYPRLPQEAWSSSSDQYSQGSVEHGQEHFDYNQETWTSSDPDYDDHLEDLLSVLSPSEDLSQRSVSTKWQRKRQYEMTLPLHVQKKRRMAANARERKRMNNLNNAFERLREILPTKSNDAKPISKMEALQMANAYIKELSSLLGSSEKSY